MSSSAAEVMLPPEIVVPGEVDSMIDRISIAYVHADVENVMTRFAFLQPVEDGISGITGEEDLDRVLSAFAQSLTDLAFEDGTFKLDIIREGFDRVFVSMNRIGNDKLGAYPISSATEALLVRMGIRRPEQRTRYAELDDRYWSVQFIEQLESEVWTKRQPEETEKHYFARYTAFCLHNFAMAPFSYLQQADY